MILPSNSDTGAPSESIQEREFNDLTMKFCSYISMSNNKCLNHVNTIAIIMKNKQYREAYLALIGSDNIFNCIKLLINNTPNLYKKITKKSIFQ